MMFAPLGGWRHVEVTDRHSTVGYAHVLKDLSETHFPKAKKIVLVQDDLNTHKPASLYEAFPAPEARRLVEKFEWHSAYLQQADPGRGGRRLGGQPKQKTCQSRLALHHRRCARKIEEVVSRNMSDSGY
jgi:hypothetical protein